MPDTTQEERDAAKRREWERRVAAEMEKRRIGDAWHRGSYFFDRLFARSGRIIFGVALAFGALWLFDAALEVLKKPFAALSPLELLGGIAAAGFGFAAISFAFFVGFGAGPSRAEANAEIDKRRRRDVESYLRVHDRDTRQRTWLYERARGMGRFIGNVMRRAKS